MPRQPFHLVEFSPWPLLLSFRILALPIGLINYLRRSDLNLLILSFITTTIISIIWWRDVIRESTFQGFHGFNVTKGLKFGVALFILSEVCFFFAFFWAYFHRSLAPTVEIGAHWPPLGIKTLNAFQMPLLNTFILLLSGITITWAHHAIEEGELISAIQGLYYSIWLGAYFLKLQYLEYVETSFSIADRIYGSCFFLATGFHGIHVAVGVTFLTVCFLRMQHFHFSKQHHVGFLAAAWYWHFVDVVWLFLYVRIYWWGS